MKENYSIWNIDLDSYSSLSKLDDKLKFILAFGALAPSSHNTQPWQFTIKGSSILVYKAPSRRLPIADVNDRQLYLSIGCAIENITIAAEYLGYSTSVVLSKEDDLIATISLSPSLNRSNDDLIFSILTRRTNRSKHYSKKIPFEILSEITSYSDSKTKIEIISEQSIINSLGMIAVSASIASMEDAGFRAELSHHVKHNLTKSKVGMPGFTQGIPTPVSFILPTLVKQFNMEKIAKKQNEILFKKYTSHIGVISTIEDSREVWINTGRTFEHIWLILNREGISLSPWGAPIQTGTFYEDIKKNLKSELRPQMFFRLGFSEKIAQVSPRFSVLDLLKI